jgi:hypothetical protein
MSDCINYTFSWMDLLIPPYQLIYVLCISYDKTILFIVSLIRLYIWYKIYTYLKSKDYIEWNYDKSLKTIGFSIIFLILLINTIYLVLVLLKKPLIDKYKLDADTTNLAAALQSEQITQNAGEQPMQPIKTIDTDLSMSVDPLLSPSPQIPSKIINTENLLVGSEGTFIHDENTTNTKPTEEVKTNIIRTLPYNANISNQYSTNQTPNPAEGTTINFTPGITSETKLTTGTKYIRKKLK